MTMADIQDRPTAHDRRDGQDPQGAASTPADMRKPYEAPRLLKKRSVARATLFTAMGVMASGLTTMG
jgi:hypothetical protein